MKKKNGFTLIELLAVIIILGILMIIAIPSVTKYISDSRKSSYVDTAKEVIGAARNLVNSGDLEMYDTNATYYIETGCLKTENTLTSPYGAFSKAYVVVTYDGNGYTYYWTSVDDAGQGIKDIIRLDLLDTDDIVSDLIDDDIKTNRTIDGRENVIMITERNECNKEGAVGQDLINVNGETGKIDPVLYPTGKTKETVVSGDIVKIGKEEFYVVKHDGNDLILLSHYNLNVGSNKKGGTTEGMQDSDVKGYVPSGSKYGNLVFSSTYYWSDKIGTVYSGNYCVGNTFASGTNCTYVYDENSILYSYVDNYKAYLEEKGATIKSARLLRLEEAFELGCGNGTNYCNSSSSTAPSWVYETSYWLGSAFDSTDIWFIDTDGNFRFSYYGNDRFFGIRPVIVI